MNWKTELYIAKLKIPEDLRYSKSLNFEVIKNFLEVRLYNKSYEDYIKPGLLYFTEDLNILARELSVDKIYPMGLYIRGIYGGEVKKGAEEYAGLVLDEYYLNTMIFKFRLHNTKDILVVPLKLLNAYGVRIYKMIYIGEINPFKLKKYLNIILSQHGEEHLKQFLHEVLKINKTEISIDTYRKIEKLISELHQQPNIKTLDINKYYVVYRRDGVFTASFFKPIDDNFFLKDEVGCIECKEESIAYYYTAILNYLAFKVFTDKRVYIRHQYARPLLALYIAGLSWKDIDDEVREKIVDLSKRLHEKALFKEYSNQRMALKDIELFPEFKELVKILDSKVDKEKLEVALNLVSGKGSEQNSD
jgi:hypothetical protein